MYESALAPSLFETRPERLSALMTNCFNVAYPRSGESPTSIERVDR